jgi:sugar transferase EpsL
VRFLKRAIDIACSLLALIVTAPLFAAAALAVRCSLHLPPIFRQQRAGLAGKPFTVYKFRTMTDQRNSSGSLLPDAERLSPIGKLLRKTSLDELPQLINVLRGEMSLVGPRPLYLEYLPRYNAFERRRHEVRPGITGWAQIHGRNTISWQERFELDVWYVDHWSLLLDFRILAGTIGKVLRREGISRENHVTMPEFLGTERESSH